MKAAYFLTRFHVPILSVTPTSQVHMCAILLLLIVGMKDYEVGVALMWYKVHIKKLVQWFKS
jgi:hypothetical protein